MNPSDAENNAVTMHASIYYRCVADCSAKDADSIAWPSLLIPKMLLFTQCRHPDPVLAQTPEALMRRKRVEVEKGGSVREVVGGFRGGTRSERAVLGEVGRKSQGRR